MKEDPYCAFDEIHDGCDSRDPTLSISTGSEKIEVLNECNLLETAAENHFDVANGNTIHKSMHHKRAAKNTVNEQSTVAPQMKVKQLVFKEELITDNSVGIS